MKNMTILSLLAIGWIAYACSNTNGKDNSIPDAETVPVRVMPLEMTDIEGDIHASGQFTTNDETWLSFKTAGVIDRIFVKEGQAVRKGQLLATLNLTEIGAQVAQAKLALEKAQRDFDRAANLFRDSVATLEQYQNARTALQMATRQLEAVQFNQAFSEIRAMADGYVLKKNANEGQVVSPGTPVLQTNSGREGNWILKVGVSDGDWARISVHDPASVEADAIPGKTLSGTVVRKSGGIDPYSGSFTVEIQLTGPVPNALASGLFGKAVVKPRHKSRGWSIPYESLLDGDGNTGYVFVTNDMKTAVQRKVLIASIDRQQVVVSAGLENAEALIVAGSAYLRDQSAIRIIPAANPVSR